MSEAAGASSGRAAGERLARLDALLAEIEAFPDPASREKAREALRGILEMHGEGLARIVERIAGSGPECAPLLDALARDELVSSLLVLHGLHPDPLETRVLRALDGVRPYLASHGGGVTLIGIDEDGTVRIRLEGSCKGCPSSGETLKRAVEEAIFAAAPDVAAIRAEGEAGAESPRPAFVPVGDVLECPLPARGSGSDSR